MASTLSSSLLILIFITTLFHCLPLSLSKPLSETHLEENPDLNFKLSKASNNGDDDADDSGRLWCVAKNNAEDAALQASIDWACGPGGADCGPIQQGGPCYDPENFQLTASYAFNDFFQKNGMTEETCNFANTAALSSLDPSHGTCKFPTRAKIIVNGAFSGSASGNGGTVGDNDSSGGLQIVRRCHLVQALITALLIFAIVT